MATPSFKLANDKRTNTSVNEKVITNLLDAKVVTASSLIINTLDVTTVNALTINASDIIVDTLTLTNVNGLFFDSSGTATFSGVWAAPQNAAFRLQRIGKTVTMRLAEIGPAAGTVAAPITSNAFIPAAFRPTQACTTTDVIVVDNAVVQQGRATIGTNGIITINPTLSTTNFAGAGSTGVNTPITFTWLI